MAGLSEFRRLDSLPRRPRVYISGPLTSSGDPVKNVLRAADVARGLIDLGYAPLCPHLTWYMDQDAEIPHDDWMAVDRPWVELADVVYRLEGDSRGADYECWVASQAGIPVVLAPYPLGDPADWLGPRGDDFAEEYSSADGSCIHHAPDDDLHCFSTGAVRSRDADGERYDLISPIGLRRVAETCAEGARKYSDFNWERGMDIPNLLNHAIRHCYLYLSGDREEDHLGHAAWGLLAACHSEEMWPGLNAGKLRGRGCTPPGGAE